MATTDKLELIPYRVAMAEPEEKALEQISYTVGLIDGFTEMVLAKLEKWDAAHLASAA